MVDGQKLVQVDERQKRAAGEVAMSDERQEGGLGVASSLRDDR